MQDYIERLLIVLNPDGSLKGAAQYNLTIMDDGRAFQGDAKPVAPDALSKILPDRSELLAHNAALVLLRDQQAAAIAGLTDDVVTARAERDQARAEMAMARDARDVLGARLAASEAASASMATELATARAKLEPLGTSSSVIPATFSSEPAA